MAEKELPKKSEKEVSRIPFKPTFKETARFAFMLAPLFYLSLLFWGILVFAIIFIIGIAIGFIFPSP